MIPILISVAIGALIYYLGQLVIKQRRFWSEKGVPYIGFFESFVQLFTTLYRAKSANLLNKELYFKFPDAPLFAAGNSSRASIFIRDLDLVEKILIKDFHYFTDRGFGKLSESGSAIEINLFNMSGKKWKALRSKLSPMFTTSKLKGMVPQIEELTQALILALEKKEKEVDIRDYFARYTMDIIASCAFGLSVKALQGTEQNVFWEMGKKTSTITFSQLVRFFLVATLPVKVSKFLKLSINQRDVLDYFSGVVRETLNQRRSTKVRRNDFVQLFVDLQQKGSIEFVGDADDEYLKVGITAEEKKLEHYEMTDDVVTGQALVFLLAGFEAAAVTMTFMCLELARNQAILERLRDEVSSVRESQTGALNYDSIKKMPFLDQCLRETMRMYTFTPVLSRECTQEYTIPGTSVTLKPGDGIVIPVVGIHSDPTIYPEPEVFKPERFDPDISRHSCSWLPFGDGPRVCIAMRFVLMEIKLCMARMVSEFDFQMNHKTVYPIEGDPTGAGLLPKHPIYLDLTKRRN